MHNLFPCGPHSEAISKPLQTSPIQYVQNLVPHLKIRGANFLILGEREKNQLVRVVVAVVVVVVAVVAVDVAGHLKLHRT